MSDIYLRLNPEGYLKLLLKPERVRPMEGTHKNLKKRMEMGRANKYDAPAFMDKIRVI